MCEFFLGWSTCEGMSVWRLEVGIRNVSRVLYYSSTLYMEAGPCLTQSSPHVSLASQLTLGIPCLHLPGLEFQADRHRQEQN